MTRAAGLLAEYIKQSWQFAGVSIARISPEKESFVYHSHQSEEEWLYILSGRGIAEIADEEIDVAAGHFMAFPPFCPASFEESFDRNLVYLWGENREMEIADFPDWVSERLKTATKLIFYQAANAKPFGPLEP